MVSINSRFHSPIVSSPGKPLRAMIPWNVPIWTWNVPMQQMVKYGERHPRNGLIGSREGFTVDSWRWSAHFSYIWSHQKLWLHFWFPNSRLKTSARKLTNFERLRCPQNLDKNFSFFFFMEVCFQNQSGLGENWEYFWDQEKWQDFIVRKNHP